MTFIETFLAVFTAMILSKTAELIITRYVTTHANKGLDKIETEIKKAFKKEQ